MLTKLHDPALVLFSLLAVFALVFAARALGRAGRFSTATLRKLLHAAVGLWTLIVTPLFHHVGWAVVPPVLFGVVNATGLARRLLPHMGDNPWDADGLWTFPLGVTLVYLFFWDDHGRRAILAGLAALAFADPVGAVVGSRFGQRHFDGFGHGRTLEGSAAFFLVAALGVGLIACGQAGGAFAWRMGIGCAFVGAVAESLTPSGWDNVSIPLAVAAAYRLLA